MSDLNLILTAAGSIVVLLLLVMKLRLHAVVALFLVSMLAGLCSGMSPSAISGTIEKGMGSTLGFVAPVVALGAMFGKIMETTGALEQIAKVLLQKFGVRRAAWATTLTGFICALPLFFDVAVVLLMGIAFAVVRQGGGSVTKIGIALLAGIASCQAFLLPAAGPILVASQLGADFGYTILFGLLAAVPAMAIGGPIFGGFIARHVQLTLPEQASPPAEQKRAETRRGSAPPTFALALGLIVLPLVLIGCKTLVSRLFGSPAAMSPSLSVYSWLQFIGHPFTALTISCLVAFYVLGVRRGIPRARILAICTSALQPAGVIILVTGAGGVFKQVLVDSGVGAALGNMLATAQLPIVVLAFLLAALVRVIQGSATVAMLTSCGLLLPTLETLALSGAQLAAITIAIGGGAIVCSHVNDSGFWLANRYLGCTEKQTLQSWTVMETLIGTSGGLVAMLIFAWL